MNLESAKTITEKEIRNQERSLRYAKHKNTADDEIRNLQIKLQYYRYVKRILEKSKPLF